MLREAIGNWRANCHIGLTYRDIRTYGVTDIKYGQTEKVLVRGHLVSNVLRRCRRNSKVSVVKSNIKSPFYEGVIQIFEIELGYMK